MGKSSRFLSSLAADAAGNTLALAAAAMIPFTILIGSGLDLSVAYMSRGKLQNACDAGVLAARQFMLGTDFDRDANNNGDPDVQEEAQRFFAFNFPAGTAGVDDAVLAVAQSEDDPAELIGTATATVPTSLMQIVGVTGIPIAVDCDATRDMGHNDVTLVLDVTGSMNCPPGTPGNCGNVEQPGSRLGRLREGAIGLFRALNTDDGSITRYAIVPYSQTANVGGLLDNRDILVNQWYVGGWQWSDELGWTFNRERLVHISQSQWNNGRGNGSEGNRQGFREGPNSCVEERPSIGTPEGEFWIEDTVTRADVDARVRNGDDEMRQFGRYDPSVQRDFSSDFCPARATMFAEYDDEDDFQEAIDDATAIARGNTYHDIGMLWGARITSRTGLFRRNGANNPVPTNWDGIPINEHIVFMSDGELMTNRDTYSAHGVERRQNRTRGDGNLNERHMSRFESACRVARGMGVTVWVIAFDVPPGGTAALERCASGRDRYFESDGTDLEDVFAEIGQGIGRLRLTR